MHCRFNALFLILCLWLAGCAPLPSPTERRSLGDSLAAAHHWQAETLSSRPFGLVAYLPASPRPTRHLTVYIEGDGLAWVNASQPSSDPTPLDPVALRLALAQPEGEAAYLARPCQFGDATASPCDLRYWTEARFAPEVVQATDQALDLLKERFGATRLTLVGYSGGGAVAALVAARRNDIERLVTVAGNLDPNTWTAQHQVRQLTGSLDPVAQIPALERLPQWHFVGEKDNNITPALVRGFAEHFPAGRRPVVYEEPGFDHRCCWVEHWPALWRRIGEPR